MHLVIKPRGGERIRVPLDRERVRIGRSSGNDVPLTHDLALSRFHLELTREGDTFFVRDVGSRHGTLLNGRPMEHPAELYAGDQITIGHTNILFADSEQEYITTTMDAPLAASTVAIPLAEVMGSEVALSRTATPPSAERGTRPQSRALALVSEAADRLRAPCPPDEILGIVLDMVAEASSPDRSAVMLLEGDPPQLRLNRVRSAQDGDEDTIQISQTIARKVVQEKHAVLTTDAQLDDRLASSDSIVALGVRSAMCVPMWNNKEVIGLIYADCVGDAGRFSKEDLQVLTLIGNMSAVKIENTRLARRDQQMQEMEKELAAAAQIQQRLLPTSAPEIPGYELTGINIPCREVGGDCFDFRLRPSGALDIVIGDVAGKGMGAALLVSTLQAEFRAHQSTDADVPSLVAHMNRAVYENSDADKFATFVLCELEPSTGQLTYTNAGHNPPLLLRTSGAIKKLESGDLVLGFLPDVSYSVRTLQIEPGDLLLLYSDGVTESRDPSGEEFGERRLIQTVLAGRDRSVQEIRRSVEEELESFIGNQERFDDVTLIVLKRNGA